MLVRGRPRPLHADRRETIHAHLNREKTISRFALSADGDVRAPSEMELPNRR